MTQEFAFHGQPELVKVKTRMTLATNGAIVQVLGRVVAECGHDIPLTVKLLVRGREEPEVLGLVEDMVRGECEAMREKAYLSACTLTLNLVRSYLSTHEHCPVGA